MAAANAALERRRLKARLAASADAQKLVEDEARRLATEAEKNAYGLLAEHRAQLEALGACPPRGSIPWKPSRASAPLPRR